MRESLAVAAALTTLVATQGAAAQQGFAEPPPGRRDLTVAAPDPFPYERPDEPDYFHHPDSTVRLHVGPAARFADATTDGGLAAALDVGSRAAGLRLAGAWFRVGTAGGLSQYTGELWLDFGYERRLHPVLAAGAGLARAEAEDPVSGGLEHTTVGVGTLRGSLQYLLPVRHTDARASLDVMAAVPAVAGESGGDLSPWVVVGASVGVGF
jgi:hypothetical protein